MDVGNGALDRMQRVRIGLMGLAVVFLLVLLAAAFFGLTSGSGEMARPGDTAGLAGNAAAIKDMTDPKEPMAELGVAPGGATAVDNLAAPPAGPVTIPAPAAPVLVAPATKAAPAPL